MFVCAEKKRRNGLYYGPRKPTNKQLQCGAYAPKRLCSFRAGFRADRILAQLPLLDVVLRQVRVAVRHQLDIKMVLGCLQACAAASLSTILPAEEPERAAFPCLVHCLACIVSLC